MSAKIDLYLAERQPATPCLVVDLNVVAEDYETLAAAFPAAPVYYAIKANPAPEILSLLNGLGAHFDASSLPEVEMALAAGASPDRISFGNTVKRESDIATAYGLGVRHFVFDSEAELKKLGRAAPEAAVLCRLAVDSAGARWPLHRKFGCSAETARSLLLAAPGLGLNPAGLSFHVGSQQMAPQRWDDAIARAAVLFGELREAGLNLSQLNLGGGLPVSYRDDAPDIDGVSKTIETALSRHFGENAPRLMLEPGRAVVARAGIIETEVLLIAEREQGQRWVYLDIGIYGGLTEAVGEAIEYPITSDRNGTVEPVILAGPTCDSSDVLYENAPYALPHDLEVGDKLRIDMTGAYTTTYASVGFNGFAPLKAYFI